MSDQRTPYHEPTVLDSVWRFRWLVLLLALGFAGLAWLYANNVESWTAEATLAVQDPRSSNLFDQAFPDTPERYVEGQVAILQSRALARQAVEIASGQTPPIVVTIDDVVDGIIVGASASSDIVTLSYAADTQREAIGVVNAVAVAYQDIARLTADAGFATAVDELDRSIDALRQEQVALDSQISARQQMVLKGLEEDPSRIAEMALLVQLIEELHALEPPSSSASDGRFDQFAADLQILTLRIETIDKGLEDERTVVLAIEKEDPERAALVGLRDEAQLRLADLQARRDQLAVDADLASSGVVFFSPAETAKASGPAVFVVLGLLAGVVIGAAVAVLLSSRRRQRFDTRSQPELVLGSRLLADIPNFRDERVESLLPVIDAPASVSAEAFRFIAASVSLQQTWPTNDDGSKNFVSVVTLSAGLSVGKTVVTANAALAAAREGQRVLVVDADFGNQQLTELLLGSVPHPMGMTDVVASRTTLAGAVLDIPHAGAGSVGLLSRGSESVRAPDFFSAPGTETLFEVIAKTYDLVLIDAPPLLRVAYATTLARLADRAMIVVAHGESVHSVEELHDQMELVGIPLIGYVYNLAPLRREMTVSAGSMADTLGEHPTSVVEIDVQEMRPPVPRGR